MQIQRNQTLFQKFEDSGDKNIKYQQVLALLRPLTLKITTKQKTYHVQNTNCKTLFPKYTKK